MVKDFLQKYNKYRIKKMLLNKYLIIVFKMLGNKKTFV